jgi:hypothetical protein
MGRETPVPNEEEAVGPRVSIDKLQREKYQLLTEIKPWTSSP